MNPKYSVCIIYGVNEGPAMARQFKKVFHDAGFIFTSNIMEATIIFAHSGGALLLPPDLPAKLIILAGPAYWPGRTWLGATWRHLKAERATYRAERAYIKQVLKWLYRSVYFFKLRTTVRMKHSQRLDAPWNSSSRQIILRNHYDEYSSPEFASFEFYGERKFISLPGGHDDCWDHPEVYAALIQSLLANKVR